MSRYDSYLLGFRYIILAGAAAGTLLTINAESCAVFMLGMLLIGFNTQLRLLTGKSKAFLVCSLLLDMAVVYYLTQVYSRLSSVILLITLADVLLKLGKGSYPLVFIITPFYTWCVLYRSSLTEGFLYLLIFAAVLLLLFQIRRELSARENTESLYDRLREANYELEATRTRLVEYSRQVETNTKLEERNRISRELHDSIGHRLAGILMQVDAGLQMMDADRSKGMELIRSAYKNISESIEVVRETVMRLNPSGHTAARTSVRELVERFSQTTGISVEYNNAGIPYELYPSVETVLYRNLQEALTNSVRHGQATKVSVLLNYEPGMLEAVISDNGRGCSRITKGFGLRGMEERLEVVGGSIEYSGEAGFTIRMRLPGKEP